MLDRLENERQAYKGCQLKKVKSCRLSLFKGVQVKVSFWRCSDYQNKYWEARKREIASAGK